ncbi:hypothetical protein [[Flexibacter] sp. ATCC 35103]|uniref:hypothetical protein n=1 Tax=[Flexibacter] sp. ATCC 35103 TaxID=1937528 RepID=UPI0009CC8F4B|nr:hypothetical protein [[Flexibacter] sp. ATCC 35103]OMQ09848.1 hypothetical protein BXU01_15815 [[Flexibacter] sp. ATCC 35103]
MSKIDKNVVIAILARDCGESLINNIPLVEELRNKFIWSKVIVVENDSIDGTKEILSDWESTSDGVKIISQDFGTKTIPDQTAEIASPTTSYYRIEKMAFYRNIYLDYISTLQHDIDYVIIIDIDIKWFSIDGLVNSMVEMRDNWGGIFSNGITKGKIWGVTSKIYYDIFAICEYPLKDVFSFTEKSLDKSFKTINKNIKSNKFYSLISAFSGIGIYKYEAIKNLRYTVVKNSVNSNEAICEHIPFNNEIIKAGYRNYISRDFSVIYPMTHNIGLRLKLWIPSNIFNSIQGFYYKLRNL